MPLHSLRAKSYLYGVFWLWTDNVYCLFCQQCKIAIMPYYTISAHCLLSMVFFFIFLLLAIIGFLFCGLTIASPPLPYLKQHHLWLDITMSFTIAVGPLLQNNIVCKIAIMHEPTSPLSSFLCVPLLHVLLMFFSSL